MKLSETMRRSPT